MAPEPNGIVRKYWYVFSLIVPFVLVNRHTVRWALAVQLGGMTLKEGFLEAFAPPADFLREWWFDQATRAFPFGALGLVFVLLSSTKYRDFIAPLYIGALPGIVGFLLYGYGAAQAAYYTGEHVSSTTALAYLFLPGYSVMVGAVAGGAVCLCYLPFRYLLHIGREDTRTR